MSMKPRQIRELMNLSFSARERGHFDKALHYYNQYLHSGYGAKDASAGFNAAIGIAYCKMHQQRFNEAIEVLLPVCLQGRFAFRRLTNLIIAYCYEALKNEQESNRYYDAYTLLIASDDRDEEREYLDAEEDVDGEDDYSLNNDYEEHDHADEEEEEEEYDYFAEDYQIDLAKGLNYGAWIKYDIEKVVTIPGILEGWLSYLSNNEKWLQSEKDYKANIADILALWADKAIMMASDEKKHDLAYRCLDLSVVFDDSFRAHSLYIKAQMIAAVNPNGARELYEESLRADGGYTPSLYAMAQLSWMEKDNDKALELLGKYEAICVEKNWKLDSLYFSLLASVYFSEGMEFADNGNYKKSAEIFRKYLAMTQPNVSSYVNRPGNRPEDLWVALAEGYDLHKALPIAGATEQLRRSLLFADIAIAENNSAKGYSAKANILCNANKLEDALACVEEALKRESNHAYSHYVKACTLSKMKAPEAQIYDSVRKVVALDNNLARSIRTEADLKHLHAEPAFIRLFG